MEEAFKILAFIALGMILFPILLAIIGFSRGVIGAFLEDRQRIAREAEYQVARDLARIRESRRPFEPRLTIDLTIDLKKSKRANYLLALAHFEDRVPNYNLYARDLFNREFEDAWIDALQRQFEADLEDLDPTDFTSEDIGRGDEE